MVNNEFQWRFKRSFIIKDTLYWCYLAPSTSNQHADFEAYDDALHEREVGNNLYWKAKDDGVYLSTLRNDGTFQDFLWHPWISGK
ncbi:unnamed protein product [Linum tenue]|nr:unnamed protein product [Linum tenue]CAI0453649.1 unnamed protein product [Linum tenue]